MNQPPFDERTWQRSIENSERRRKRIQERRSREKRLLLRAAIVLAVLVILVFLIARLFRQPDSSQSEAISAAGTPAQTSSSQDAPAPQTTASASEDQSPQLVISWPQFQQTLNIRGERAFVALRPGRPLTLSLREAGKWQVEWSGDGVQTVDGNAVWEAVTDAPTLTARIRPPAAGMAKLTAWMRAPITVNIQGFAAQSRSHGLWALAAVQKAGDEQESTPTAWISPQVGAWLGQPVIWDERVLPLLEAASNKHPYAGPQPGPGRSMPTPPPRAPRWQIVPSFEGVKGKREANDKATYAAINSADALDGSFPANFIRMARTLSQQAPQASIKLIVKDPDTAIAAGIIRIAFDDSGQRDGWIKRAEEQQGEPFEWWE